MRTRTKIDLASPDVTPEFFASVGFAYNNGLFSIDAPNGLKLHLSYSGWGAFLYASEGDESGVPLPKTESDVRRLARSLGIELKA